MAKRVEPVMVTRLRGYWKWLTAGQFHIKNRRGKLVPMKPNKMQKRIHGELTAIALRNQPIRFIDLKARKGGASTYFQGLGYYLAKTVPHWSSRTVAHTMDATRDIIEITRRCAKHDETSPKATEGKGAWEFDHDSTISARTAGGENVSSGATVNFLHMSEVPKWPGTKSMVKAQIASLVGSVPKVPESIIIFESTANMLDISGQFKAYWDASKKGKGRFVPFFAPWIEDEDYQLPGVVIADKTDYERQIQAGHGVTDAQLAWRRTIISEDFAGDERYFMQEYPLTEEEAFQSPSGLIFPMLRVGIHGLSKSTRSLLEAGYELYRGFDWGDADAFTCVWIAHKLGQPGFSVDIDECPNVWRELTGYAWDDHGRPRDENDHAIDSMRYAISYFEMTGHVHVYREMYIEEAAARQLSVLDLAKQAVELSIGEPIVGSVGDRSRPGTILLLAQQGLPVEPYYAPAKASDRGEKGDGIMRMQALMNATRPLVYPRPPDPWQVCMIEERKKAIVPSGLSSLDLIAALDHWERDNVDDTEDPWFGHCN
jgi:hypothetical protein